MGTTIIPAKPLFDVQGNLNLHGRSSLYLPWKSYTDLTYQTQIDISGYSLFFEVEGVLRQKLVSDPADPLGLLLDIPSLADAELLVMPPLYPRYVLRDETGADPVVRAQGKIIVYGFEAQPE